ncbi:MAG: choice-of-anchor D domain-containing protein [Flavobacterium sp.]|uniref:choice-of-anchor D domain-containing protein n=1 Tax=Flavobacterium sp. TaxID=239 RepID=UPI0022C33A78|nr:choice-of-anchor D domain-containing protein [Flavobacterium sp.]MCZ8196936.1 choice-of-anchor D domain-containing protein [Flavobacterium sp.]
MKKILFLVTFLSIALGYGQISISGTGVANTYSQNFDALAITGTSSTVPSGWAFSETSATAPANTLYTAGTGSANSGDTYSFGTAASTERAFGGLRSGSNIPTIGASFTNNTGATITSLVITYKGETWRIGALNRSDRLDFQYSVNATSLTTGTWTDENTLDYANPGQAVANGSQLHMANLSSTVSGLGIVNGATFWIRWSDFDATGADDGMAIDDFSIYVNGGGATAPEINIKGNGASIVDGATPASLANHTLFGTVSTNTSVTRTYTIENLGSADLVLPANPVSLTLSSAQYTIAQPASTTIAAGGSTTFSVTFNSATAGLFDDGIEVLSNDDDEANYSFDISATAEAPTPEINIRGNSTNIVDGATTPLLADHTSFGTLATGNTLTRTYTIQNTGTGNLVLTAPYVQLGTASTQYTITQPALTTIPPAGSTTFSVAFSSATAGTFNNTIEVLSDDADEATYSFAITADAVTLNFQPGDISFVGVTTTSDAFSFVNWVDIPVNAQLSFTDNAYNGTALNSNEQTLVWRNNTGSAIPSGTVITVTCPAAGAATTDLGTVISGSLNGLSSANENVFIFEGLSTTPNFIYGFSNIAWITTGTASTNTSYLPAALNVANGNLVTGILDNYEYTDSRSGQIAIVLYKNTVNNAANWTGSNTVIPLSSTDFTYVPVLTQLSPSACGVTLPFVYTSITSTILPAATGYRFEVTNLTTPADPVQVITKNVHWFRLTELPRYDYGTAYSVKVMMQVGGVWLGYYGNACIVNSPSAPSLVSPSCGRSVDSMFADIKTTALTGVTGYRYKVTSSAGVQILDRTFNWFRLNQLPIYTYGDSYTVEIAVKTSGAYSAYSEPCVIGGPSIPAITSCGQTVAFGSSVLTSAQFGVTQYSFKVVNLTTLAEQIINKPVNNFPTALIPGYSTATQYSISVAVTSSGVQSEYGTTCTINTPAPFRIAKGNVDAEFKAVGYPNPFATNFTLNVTTTNDQNVKVQVYDMIGKQLENLEVNANESSDLQLGANYPAGVYNVIVSQGDTVKSVRMIKR